MPLRSNTTATTLSAIHNIAFSGNYVARLYTPAVIVVIRRVSIIPDQEQGDGAEHNHRDAAEQILVHRWVTFVTLL
jgi:hypothetical protein